MRCGEAQSLSPEERGVGQPRGGRRAWHTFPLTQAGLDNRYGVVVKLIELERAPKFVLGRMWSSNSRKKKRQESFFPSPDCWQLECMGVGRRWAWCHWEERCVLEQKCTPGRAASLTTGFLVLERSRKVALGYFLLNGLTWWFKK